MSKQEQKELKAACARLVKACQPAAAAYKRHLQRTNAYQRFYNEAEKIGPAF